MVGLPERLLIVCIISRLNAQDPWRAADSNSGAAPLPTLRTRHKHAAEEELVYLGESDIRAAGNRFVVVQFERIALPSEERFLAMRSK
jgi:hypothetical protein